MLFTYEYFNRLQFDKYQKACLGKITMRLQCGGVMCHVKCVDNKWVVVVNVWLKLI